MPIELLDYISVTESGVVSAKHFFKGMTMPPRKEHRSDKMPSELERDAKTSMEPVLAGALLHRLSDVDLLRLNGWLDQERRAAADELWSVHKDAVSASEDLLKSCQSLLSLVAEAIMHGMPITKEVADIRNAAVASIVKATGKIG